MDSGTRRLLGRTFDDVAGEYGRARPGYPPEAAHWLVDGGEPRATPLRVLDLGAGTGALTRQLARTADSVHAADPGMRMLAELGRVLPGIPRVRCTGERLPYRPDSFDVVTVAQAFHWLHHELALPEIVRVLRPDGVIAVVYNTRDESSGWARRFGDLITAAQPVGYPGGWDTGSVAALTASPLFTAVATSRFVHEQLVDRAGLVELAASRSYVSTLDPAGRARLLERVGSLFDTTVAAADADVVGDPPRLRMSYLTECWRARVASTVSAPGSGYEV
jgi:ubiquinone/menaquinone biosynthesis C-methylase UbiE